MNAQAAQHMCFEDGFSLLALNNDDLPVGLIAVQWRHLLPPLTHLEEGFINIIEVRSDFRRQGVASRLIERAVRRAVRHGAYQVRAWSSEDKVAALAMWQALGFGLCPTTVFPPGQTVNGYFVTRQL